MKPDVLLYFLAPYLLETEPLGAQNLTVLHLGCQTASHIEPLISATSVLSPVATGVCNHTLNLNTCGEDPNSDRHSFTEATEPFLNSLAPNC